jgi:glycine reductase complex component B subunit gamma
VVKAVHYLNQFFAGIGGEEAAGTPPTTVGGPVGPGRGLQAALDEVAIVATIACGDDYFAEQEDDALERLVGFVRAAGAELVIAGPAFGSGRYGYAAARIAATCAERLGVAAVAAMHPENPGVGVAGGRVLLVPTGPNVAGMRDALPRMASLAAALASGRELGPPEVEGYLPRGFRRNELTEETGAARAIDALLAKLTGDVRSEVDADFDRVPPPPPVPDLSRALLALVTESGCVPRGNPDRLPSVRSRGWLRYSIAGRLSLGAEEYESVHGGFDVTLANEDPNRIVPLDAVSACADAGRVGAVHDVLYTTTGNGTPVEAATRFGREIADELDEAGVQAVILSGT